MHNSGTIQEKRRKYMLIFNFHREELYIWKKVYRCGKCNTNSSVVCHQSPWNYLTLFWENQLLKSLLKEGKGKTQYPTISNCFGSIKTQYLVLKTLQSCLSEKTLEKSIVRVYVESRVAWKVVKSIFEALRGRKALFWGKKMNIYAPICHNS